jgi:hypothetical protein
LKILMPPASTPRTRPKVVTASMLRSWPLAGRHKTPADNAVSAALRFRNSRRERSNDMVWSPPMVAAGSEFTTAVSP